MPHLNDIHARYYSRGLRIVAVSRESADVIESEGVNGLRMYYPVAMAKGASGLYGVQGIPHALVIGKDGKVLWRGHPGYINDGMIDAWLGGTALPEGSQPSAESDGSIPFFVKFGLFVLLSGGVLILVLRVMRPRQAPAYPTYPQAPMAQGGQPPQRTDVCGHCGAPLRLGRKTCMGCGALV